MLGIDFIREHPDIVKENIKKKFKKEKLKYVDEILDFDKKWKKVKYDEEQLRAERNKISKEINEAKKVKDEKKAQELLKRARKIPDEIIELEKERLILEDKIKSMQSLIPNIMSKRVPMGENDSKNVGEKTVGKIKKFNFPIKSHVELAEKLGLADFESSARVSGNGFYYIEGDLALLNAALINYAREIMVKKGFRYIETPLLLRESVIDRVTDLNDKNQQIYIVQDESPMALIGTSEHSLIGRYVNQEIDEKALPIKHTSYSMCFRKEIGSHGIDEKGLYRTHQFNKMEMIVICKPEESDKFFEEMQNITLEIFKGLDIPVRVLRICSGDLGDLKYEQVDIEAWSPRKNTYFEVGSCSNLTEAQARKLGITTRINNVRITPHTLNNTAIATSRALVALLENNQNADGSINIPKALQKYMHKKKITAQVTKKEKKK